MLMHAPGAHKMLDIRDVLLSIIFGWWSISVDDLWDRLEVPVIHVEFANQLVPVCVALLPGLIGSKALLTGVAIGATNIAQTMGICCHPIFAKGALLVEERQGKDWINAILDAQLIER